MKMTVSTKAFLILAAGFATAITIGCTSTPSVEDSPAADAEISATEPEFSSVESTVETTMDEPQSEPMPTMESEVQSTSTTNTEDLSLGASSSGRGH